MTSLIDDGGYETRSQGAFIMGLKPEVVRILTREKVVSEVAIARLQAETEPLESEYGWSTVAIFLL